MKLNSKVIKDLNVRPDTLILTGEKAGNSLELIDQGNTFLNRTLRAHALEQHLMTGSSGNGKASVRQTTPSFGQSRLHNGKRFLPTTYLIES